jgi:hypothetical protein
VSRLVLYSRRGCHLCEEMLEDLESLCRDAALEVIDVDGDAALVSRYGARVPVLVADDREVCAGRLDRTALAACLRRKTTP